MPAYTDPIAPAPTTAIFTPATLLRGRRLGALVRAPAAQSRPTARGIEELGYDTLWRVKQVRPAGRE
jgi:hypothetical protein